MIRKTILVKKLELFILFAILLGFLFLSRDYYIDTIDLKSYMNYYNDTVTFSDVFLSKSAWKGDYLFFIWMPVAHFFNLEPTEYITVQTILSIGLLFIAYSRFYVKKNNYLFLALFLVTCTSSFYHISGNVLRQGLASSILLISLTDYKGKMRSFFYKVLAVLTHRGSMFSFLGYILPKTKKKRLITFIVALILGSFSMVILLKLPLPEFYRNKIIWYSEFQRASNNSLLKLILLVIFNFIFFIFGNYNELKYKKAYNLFFTFSVASMLFYNLDGVFSRLVLFTDIFIPILLVGLVEGLNITKNRIIIISTLIILGFIYSIYVFNHSSMEINFGASFKFF